VSSFSREVRALLEASYPELWIEGEITNLSTPASGHAYFSLKDDTAQIRCALFRQHRLRCPAEPRAGLKVLVRARVSLYEARGDFQLIVEYMEEAGEGALRRELEALKRRLAAEGLFDESAKRALPPWPRQLGVISSPSGAALRDILITLGRTAPWLPVVIYPVTVQGDSAAPSIVAALERATRRAECDVLIVARGGGSLEDLMAFNDERVARAVHACPIPVISGVGHETDVTIVDLVADVRAATPTAAAQRIGDASERLAAELARQRHALVRGMENCLYRAMQAVDRLAGRIRHPLERVRHQLTRVDHVGQRLVRNAEQSLAVRRSAVRERESMLRAHSPARAISAAGSRIEQNRIRLQSLAHTAVQLRRDRLDTLERQAGQLSPRATLARGYAVLIDAEHGHVVSSMDKARTGQRLEGRLADGSVDLSVTGKRRR